MDTAFINLWSALARAGRAPPRDLRSALRELQGGAPLPSPWVTWTLIGLFRHRERQLWVEQIMRTRLGGDPESLARHGYGGHPEGIPQRGLVPGLPEWEYDFHGRGCCLTHRVTGEAIDVDFYDDTGEHFDGWFYIYYLKSLKQPERPEQRLLSLHPSFEPVLLSVAELREAGVLEDYPESTAFRLATAALEHTDKIDAFCRRWALADGRLWLAALIGDWPAARDAAVVVEDPELLQITGRLAESCRSRYENKLCERFHAEEHQPQALLGLADLDARELDRYLQMALDGKPSPASCAALEIISERNDTAWCKPVYTLLMRLDHSADAPQPYLWAACAAFLLRHDYSSTNVFDRMQGAHGHTLGELALLALEYRHASALPLFRRALRSENPWNRLLGAAVLALIDEPWSRKELLAVLEESDDPEMTAECRAALWSSHDEHVRESVSAWEERYPHEPEVGPFISLRELRLRQSHKDMQFVMTKYHDRVMRIRSRGYRPQ